MPNLWYIFLYTTQKKEVKMSNQQTLTVAELQSLLVMHFEARQLKQAKFQAHLQHTLSQTFTDYEVPEENAESVVIKKKGADWISNLLAHRLNGSPCTIPLFSSEDLEKFVPSMIDAMEQAKNIELEVEDRRMLEKFLNKGTQNLFDIVHGMVPPGDNQYEAYWRWIDTVLDLAAERGVLPIELLALEEATDEITRRMFSKEQFIALFNNEMSELTDTNMYKAFFLVPTLDVSMEEDETKRLWLEQELEQFKAEIMPQLREVVEKLRVFLNTRLNEDVTRIYATA
jgi:hypothetical protein